MKKDGRGHPQEVLNKGKGKRMSKAQKRAEAACAHMRDFLLRGTPTWGTEKRKPFGF